MEAIDFYALLDSRNHSLANIFLEKYLLGYEELSEGYSYPPYLGEVEFETDSFDDMLSFLSKNGSKYYRFYFDPNSDDSIIKKGMLFFNTDDTMTIGIRTSEDVVQFYADKIKAEFAPTSVLMGFGIAPPSNAKEFMAIAAEES